jgi:5-aminolevulinate synthase
MAVDPVTALKRFGQVCPFLARSSVTALRTFSTQSIRGTAANRLSELASTRCPLMSVALAQRGFASVAAVRGSVASVAASASQATNQKATKVTFSSSAPISLGRRTYASITEIEDKAARTATAVPSKSAQPSFVNPASISTSSSSSSGAAAAGDAAKLPEVHSEGRPTCALGFAKHRVTSYRPGQFDYDSFYAAELEKKHQDKSYRVS